MIERWEGVLTFEEADKHIEKCFRCKAPIRSPYVFCDTCEDMVERVGKYGLARYRDK